VIVERSGAPPSSDQWQWIVGFYPGSNPGDERHGTTASFEAARAEFEAAWREYLPKRSEADFQEWRDDAAWHAAKYERRLVASDGDQADSFSPDPGVPLKGLNLICGKPKPNPPCCICPGQARMRRD
jgi:hypothetical protein